MKQLVNWILAGLIVVVCVGAILIKQRSAEPPASRRVQGTNQERAVRRVQDRGIEVSAAPVKQLLTIGKEEGLRWRPDAKLTSIRVRPAANGLVDLTEPGAGASYVFWSDKEQDAAEVIIWSGGEIALAEHADTPSKRELPEKFVGVEEAVSRARDDGWKQKVHRAMLFWHSKKDSNDRLAWTIVGDGSVPDDLVYCLDAETGKPFMSHEIEEFLEVPRKGSAVWTKGSSVAVLKDAGMQMVWQAVEIPVAGGKAMVPIRPYTDPERQKVLRAGTNADVQVGPGVALSSEERRVFRSIFGERAVNVGVEPGTVVAEGDPAGVRDAVEKEYAKRVRQ